MVGNYLLAGLFGTLNCFVAGIFGREAIVGGVAAKHGEFPYQVSIEIAHYGHGCGGGIISDTCIITSANCLINVHGQLGGKPVRVLAGTIDFRKIDYPAVTVEVAKIYVPREYSPHTSNTTGDIAVLKLKEPLNLSKNRHLEQLRLPTSKQVVYTNVTAQIAGYGWTWARVQDNKQYGGRNNTRLHFAKAEILDASECQENHPTLKIDSKHLCARVKQRNYARPRGACVGDGGGPLVYYGTVVGIFSLGPKGCAEKNSSAIYTRVSHYLYFIRYAKEDTPTKRMLMYELD